MFGLGKVEDKMAFNRQRIVRFYDERAKPTIRIHQKRVEFATTKFGVASSGKNKIFVAGDELRYNAKPDHATLIAIPTACSALASRRIGISTHDVAVKTIVLSARGHVGKVDDSVKLFALMSSKCAISASRH